MTLDTVQDIKSDVRREKRYWNRKRRREEARKAKNKKYSDYDEVFTLKHLYKSYLRCIKGYKWKDSVCKFMCNPLRHVYHIFKALAKRRFKRGRLFKFRIRERGKEREIQSIELKDRIMRKCLCDYSLVPTLVRTLIYDNGASQKGKGTSHSIKRIKKHIADFVRRDKEHKGAILLFDFKGFFANIWHKEVLNQVKRSIDSLDIMNIIETNMNGYTTETDDEKKVGLGLGGQDSQVLALVAPNRLDHYIKDDLGLSEYARYMDDGYIIGESIEFLKGILEKIKKKCEELHIYLNTKKTRIQSLYRPFVYLKKRFRVSEKGKQTLQVCRDSVIRMRRKLKRFKNLEQRGIITWKCAWDSIQSWTGSVKRYKSYKMRQSIYNLYDKLFINDWRYGYVL